MIPKLHAKGASFRGAAVYVLHDKEADTSERVAWTETRNLATKNPDAAWRVMAATALDAKRLKVEAGIKATGRKSKDSVLHLTLSWHPDETEQLTKEEMIAAAEGAMTALKADDHQALFVCHDDEEQPHVHILVNRVSTADGRMLPSSKEKLALSKWAQIYEEGRRELTGKIYCEERVLNNAARARGTYVRGQKDVPRHIFELEAGNDNEPWAVKLRQEQQAKDLEVRRKEVAQKARHSVEWKAHQRGHEDGRVALRQQHKRETTIAKQTVGDGFLPHYAELAVQQEGDRQAFGEREETLYGKGLNILKAIDWTGMLRQERRSVAIKEAFGLLGGRVGPRSEALRRGQQRQMIELEKREAEAKRLAVEGQNREHRTQLQKHGRAHLLQRQGLIFRHQMDGSLIGTEWLERKKQRVIAWEAARGKHAVVAFEKTATPEDDRKLAAETFMGRMRKARSEREREKDREKSTKLTLRERREAHERDRERGPDEGKER